MGARIDRIVRSARRGTGIAASSAATTGIPINAASQMIGAKELNDVLRALPDALAKNALDAVARAGAVEFKKHADVRLQSKMTRSVRKTDLVLKKSKIANAERRSEFRVGPNVNRPQLRWLHDGTAPHVITIQQAEVLGTPAENFGEAVAHPGQHSRPYLREALFSSSDAVKRVMAEKMAPALAKQANKLSDEAYTGKLQARRRRR